MDIRTERRIAAYKAKKRADKSDGRPKLTAAELAYRKKKRDAKLRKPGFGSSSSSVADHLNEVVGLTEHKMTAKEIRDKRIEAAAKSGLGCQRFLAAANPSMIPKRGKYGNKPSRADSTSTSCNIREKTFRVALSQGHKLGGTTTTSSSNQRKVVHAGNREKQLSDMRKARQAYFERLEQTNTNSPVTEQTTTA